MTSMWEPVRHIAVQTIATVVSGPNFMAAAILVATGSVGGELSRFLGSGLLPTFEELKRQGLRRLKAGTRAQEVGIRKLVAEAMAEENKATLQKRDDRISKAEEQKKLAEAAKTNADAQAALMIAEAEAARIKAEALKTLIEAVEAINKKGGFVAIKPEELRKLIGLHEPRRRRKEGPKSDEPPIA